CGICVTQYWWDNWPKTKTAKNWLSNLSWVTATFFVTPILLYETRSATQAVRRSAELVKKHWGNVLVSQLNIRMNAWTIHLLSLIPTFIALLIGGKIIIIIGSTITVILFLIIFSVSCTLRLILGAALYLFAKEHDLSAYYDVDLLKNAFRIK
ncbi:MAG: DUF6159 family protein, partial [Gammaproteobacteria bacterium]|nr:DUF6159 family protein [Gammaproteobacteria bacterium]